MGTVLNIAYKSQYDADAGESRNDCGPACLAMLLNALGVAVTTDGVFRRTGAPADGYVSTAQLMRASESYGAPLEYHLGWGLGELRGRIDLAQPSIALVHYAAFSELNPGVSTQSNFKGPHFVLVVGYDEGHITVHDPLWTSPRREEGAFKVWSNSVFLQAWGQCHEDGDAQGNHNPDFSVMASVHAIDLSARTQVAADVLRRICARAAFNAEPQPDLAEPDTLKASLATLGTWGQRTTVRVALPTDTLWSLAQAYYGDGRKMNVIQYFNGLDPADVLHTGHTLLIPEPTRAGDEPNQAIPAGLTPSPQLGGPVKH
jgi:Peptidase_C39 like family